MSISFDEDGVQIEKITKDELLERLNVSEHEGESPLYGGRDFLEEPAEGEEYNSPYIEPGSILVIKGEAVVPEAAQRVTEYRVL